MLDFLALGAIPSRGNVRQEDVALDVFLANRFGSIYASEEGILSRLTA